MRNYPDFVLLNIGYKELNANWNWRDICSPFARIYMVVGGTARTRIGGVLHDLLPGNLYLIPPFTDHDDICDGPFNLYYIHFYDSTHLHAPIFDSYTFRMGVVASELHSMLVKRLLSINPGRHLHHIDPGIYDNAASFHRFEADNVQQTEPGRLETQGILNQLVSVFISGPKKMDAGIDSRIHETLEHIHRHIDQELTVSELAAARCLTPDHFIRIFRKEVGVTPLKYINRKKIERAQVLLTTTDQSIRRIAEELSLANITYFNRLFRQMTGKSPGEYRNSGQNI